MGVLHLQAAGAALQKLDERLRPFFIRHQTLDAAVLKRIAVITMFIDHFAYAFLEVRSPKDGLNGILRMYGATEIPMEVLEGLDGICRLFGRTAFPIFLFLVVEGYLHTRSRLRYSLRVLVFAALSYFPFQYLFFPASGIRMNVMFTLFWGIVAMWGVDELILSGLGMGSRRNEDRSLLSWAWRLPLGLLIAAFSMWICKFLHSDYSWGGVLALLLMFVFRQARPLSFLAGYGCLSYYNLNEFGSITGFILAQCYNGSRGRQNKYFFYFFYPAHLALLLWLRYMAWGF